MKLKEQIKILWVRFRIWQGSIDRNLKGSSASIYFVKDELPKGVRLTVRGVEFFYEGKPDITSYKNNIGNTVKKYTWRYGGWGKILSPKEE